MKIAITGTPGTGKTTCSKKVETGYEIVHLNEIIKEKKLYSSFDEKRQTLVADIEAIDEEFKHRSDIVIDSHISHLLDVDKVIVLRCHPNELKQRLKNREYEDSVNIEMSVEENINAEALDVILIESINLHGKEKVHEIDGTGEKPEAVAREIERIIAGKSGPKVGLVSFIEYLFEN